MANILLVEDDPHINNINKQALASEGYNAICVTTVQNCLKTLASTAVDLILLDIDLPDESGLEACKKIKEKHDVPIIFLTAMGENSDIVQGLNAGGDDYITKPYDLAVLIARIKVKLRHERLQTKIVALGELQIDNISGIARYNDKDLLLTKRELLLLRLLIDKKGVQINRDDLCQKVWGYPSANDFNALRVLVSRVKAKLLAVGCNAKIVSERQKGYTLYE